MKKPDISELRARTAYPFIRSFAGGVLALHLVVAGIAALIGVIGFVRGELMVLLGVSPVVLILVVMGFALREVLSIIADGVDTLLELRTLAVHQHAVAGSTLEALSSGGPRPGEPRAPEGALGRVATPS